MSFTSRLWRVLRGQSGSWSSLDPDELLDQVDQGDDSDEDIIEGEWRRVGPAGGRTEGPGAASGARSDARSGTRSSASAQRNEPDGLAKAYARLELKPGATAAEAKAAWRRLMQRYHPDRHSQDPRKQEVATRLTAALTEAYRTIRDHAS